MPLAPVLQAGAPHRAGSAFERQEARAGYTGLARRTAAAAVAIRGARRWRRDHLEQGAPDETHVGLRTARGARRRRSRRDFHTRTGRVGHIGGARRRHGTRATTRLSRSRQWHTDGAFPTMSAAAPPIRILVVDDHTLFAGARGAAQPRSSVRRRGGCRRRGRSAASRARTAAGPYCSQQPPAGVNGVDALPALLESVPAARVLMLTVSESETDLLTALRNARRLSAEDDAKGTRWPARSCAPCAAKPWSRTTDRQARERLSRCGGGTGNCTAPPPDRAALAARTGNLARDRARCEQQGHRSRARPSPTVKIHVRACCASSTSASRVQAAHDRNGARTGLT